MWELLYPTSITGIILFLIGSFLTVNSYIDNYRSKHR